MERSHSDIAHRSLQNFKLGSKLVLPLVPVGKHSPLFESGCPAIPPPEQPQAGRSALCYPGFLIDWSGVTTNSDRTHFHNADQNVGWS